ncbi:hypothetical protein VKT23_005254 [Stygiomarasmius scandens]|uniref:Uncharacterized protein n=1 Tax=Marasmiellus scandens TaxID=2682957 RepID=A0ABR1JQJ8_9AGAR
MTSKSAEKQFRKAIKDVKTSAKKYLRFLIDNDSSSADKKQRMKTQTYEDDLIKKLRTAAEKAPEPKAKEYYQCKSNLFCEKPGSDGSAVDEPREMSEDRQRRLQRLNSIIMHAYKDIGVDNTNGKIGEEKGLGVLKTLKKIIKGCFVILAIPAGLVFLLVSSVLGIVGDVINGALGLVFSVVVMLGMCVVCIVGGFLTCIGIGCGCINIDDSDEVTLSSRPSHPIS